MKTKWLKQLNKRIKTNGSALEIYISDPSELGVAAVILDKQIGKSKVCGFVTFKHVDGALPLKESRNYSN